MGDRRQNDWERLEESHNMIDGSVSIYPYPFDATVGKYYKYIYNHEDLAGFSKRALEKYNQEMVCDFYILFICFISVCLIYFTPCLCICNLDMENSMEDL